MTVATGPALLGALLGAAFAVGMWTVLLRVPRRRRPDLVSRVAPYLSRGAVRAPVGVRPVVQAHGTALQRARFFNSLVQMQLRSERYQASADTVAHARAYTEAALEARLSAERAAFVA